MIVVLSTAPPDPTEEPSIGDDIDNHDRGLQFDLQTLFTRRRALGLIGAAGAAFLVGCSTGSDTSTGIGQGAGSGSGPGTPPGGSSSGQTADGAIPEETAGPYPGDGSNGVDVLDDSGIVRSDIRSSFGGASAVAAGVPLTIALGVTDLDGKPIKGAAVYLWHCDRDGQYSMYSDAIADQNYLRGVQPTDADGAVTFTSIFPACYSGRWPHVHFEVYGSVADATTSGPIIATSQLALPESVCKTVYATEGYPASVANLAQVSLDTDLVFADDHAVHQLAAMKGNVDTGYTASLSVPVDA
ncbi:MAG TPA: intradiol ring-cleavage dioxygenase [Nocardioidaceae bacterium]|nr:intradiol ring-cleavage dioxygenase [Nocardioidaceae bacterium]